MDGPKHKSSLAEDVFLLAIDDDGGYTTSGPVGPVVAAARIFDQLHAGIEEQVPVPAELVRHLKRRGRTVVAEVVAGLSAAGAVEPMWRRTYGVIPRPGYRVLDLQARADAMVRLRKGLGSAAADRNEAALAVLCAESGIAVAALGELSFEQRAAVSKHLQSMASSASWARRLVVAVRETYRDRSAGQRSQTGAGDSGDGSTSHGSDTLGETSGVGGD